METLSERQENELFALLAIYIDDVVDLRTRDAWKVQRAPEVDIVLRPQESTTGRDCHVTVTLRAKCPEEYPDKAPELSFTSIKGLSKLQSEELLQQLNTLAKQLLGEVMLLQLCQHAQEYLHSHNQPPAPSFHDTMLANQKRQLEQQSVEKRLEAERHRKQEEEQIAEFEEELQKRKEETRKLRYDMKAVESEDEEEEERNLIDQISRPTKSRSSSARSRSRTLSDGRGSDGCNGHATSLITIRDSQLYRGRCLGQSARGNAVYVVLDKSSGWLGALTEWVIRYQEAIKSGRERTKTAANDPNAKQYLSLVRSIESEFNACLKLSHPHLLAYHGLNCKTERGQITVSVLTDFVGGGSLTRFIENQQPVPIDQLQRYTSEALEALTYLHSKSITHKDLRFSSLLLDSCGNLQLADYSINKRLAELVERGSQTLPAPSRTQTSVLNETPSPSINDELPSLGKGGKKLDVYRLGVVLLSLAEGAVVRDALARPGPDLPAVFRDFLLRSLDSDERLRWSADQLLGHSFLKTPLFSSPLPQTGAQIVQPHANDRPESGDEEENEGSELVSFVPSPDSGSRLYSEFTILKSLGKGAFGDVIKVRNKLDQRLYAIKRIPLNPQRQQLNRKIMREVKLLSRLSHENVVRYYNSWIEKTDLPANSDSSCSTSTVQHSTPDPSQPVPQPNARPATQPVTQFHKQMHRDGLSLGLDDIEAMAPSPVNASTDEWSSAPSASGVDIVDSSSDEDDDGELFIGPTFMMSADEDEESDDEDGGVVFETSTTSSPNNDSHWSEAQGLSAARGAVADLAQQSVRPCLQFLYIQMEYCEKSTLRTCIDDGLFMEPERVWRLFREIIEGLVHIHEQGMIHRDLKPVNIFLDSNDQVKIGDFGLATVGSLQQPAVGTNPGVATDLSHTVSQTSLEGAGDRASLEGSEAVGADGGLTGAVGTALYASPEVMAAAGHKKPQYSQKVDLYSLGIIFFEMCYRPLLTGMERIRVLVDLRRPEITLPPDFDTTVLSKQALLIRLILQHDPCIRPTARELLANEHLPVPEVQLTPLLAAAMAKPHERTYRRLIDTLFSQRPPRVTALLYDHDMFKTAHNEWRASRGHSVRMSLRQLFRRFGAVEVNVPLLIPHTGLYTSGEQPATLLDDSGTPVTLPFDLRVPFARRIAKQRITQLRRYSIEPVYSQARMRSTHPRQITAASFDIVTPTPSGLVPDAEVLSVVYALLNEFPALAQRGDYIVRLNHTSLLTAILLHCGVPAHAHSQVLQVLTDAKRERKQEKVARLQGLSLPAAAVTQLFTLIEIDQPLDQASSRLRCITKVTGSEAAVLAKGALRELKDLSTHVRTLVGSRVVHALHLTPGLLLGYAHFSGAFFQVAAKARKRKTRAPDVLAVGGRYDRLLELFRPPGVTPVAQSAVGVNIAFDKIVSATLDDKGFEPDTRAEVVVASLVDPSQTASNFVKGRSGGEGRGGSERMLCERLGLVRDLRSRGLCAFLLPGVNAQGEESVFSSTDDATDWLRQRVGHAPYLVLLRHASVPPLVLSRDKDKVREEGKRRLEDLADYLAKLMNSCEVCEQTSSSGGSSTAPASASLPNTPSGQPNSHQTPTASGAACEIKFLLDENSRLAKNTRRQNEARVSGTLRTALGHLSPRCKVQVIGLELPVAVLHTVAAKIQLTQDRTQFKQSCAAIIDEHPRHRKSLVDVCDVISDLYNRFRPDETFSSTVIVLYALKDDEYRFLL